MAWTGLKLDRHGDDTVSRLRYRAGCVISEGGHRSPCIVAFHRSIQKAHARAHSRRIAVNQASQFSEKRAQQDKVEEQVLGSLRSSTWNGQQSAVIRAAIARIFDGAEHPMHAQPIGTW